MRYGLVALVALLTSSIFAAELPLPKGVVARLGTAKFRTGGTGIVLSPDGTRAAVRVGDGIDVLNLDTGDVVAQLRDEKKLKKPYPDNLTFAFALGGKELVTANDSTEVQVWDAETGKPLRSIGGLKKRDGAPARIHAFHNCQLANFVLTESGNGLQKLDVKTGKWEQCAVYSDNTAGVSPDGRWVTKYIDMASIENYVCLIDTTTGERVHEGTSSGNYPFQQAPSPDGKFLAWTVSEVGVEVRNVVTKKDVNLKRVNPQISHGDPRFSPNGKMLLVNMPGSRQDVKTPPHFARWDVTTGERLPDWKLPAAIQSWAVDHKNNRVVVLAGGCVFRIDIATGKLQGPPDGFISEVRPALSPDGKRAAVGDAAGLLRVWDVPFTGEPRTLRASGAAVHDLTFTGDGRTLYVGYADCSVGMWDVAKGQETCTLKPPVKEIRRGPWDTFCIATSPDGKTLVGQVASKRMWAWDVGSGKVLWEELAGKEKPVITGCRPAFTPDSSVMYYGRDRGDVSKFDPRTGKERVRYETAILMRADVKQLALTPDGQRLIGHARYNDSELAVFEVGSEAAIWRLQFKDEEAVRDLALTASGAVVVTAHVDGTIRGWKALDGSRVFTLRGPAGYAERLQLSADGKLAIIDAPDTTALVWKLPE